MIGQGQGATGSSQDRRPANLIIAEQSLALHRTGKNTLGASDGSGGNELRAPPALVGRRA